MNATRLLAVAVVPVLAGCGGAPDPLVEGYPLVLAPPSGWVEVPEDRQGPDDVSAPVIYAAQPATSSGDAALVVRWHPGQAASVTHGIALAEGTRHESGQDYDRGEPTALGVDGAEEAPRLDYTYTCPDTNADCSGTAFVLLAEDDLYVVRVSMREGGGVGPEEVDRLEESLSLTE